MHILFFLSDLLRQFIEKNSLHSASVHPHAEYCKTCNAFLGLFGSVFVWKTSMQFRCHAQTCTNGSWNGNGDEGKCKVYCRSLYLV